LHTNLHPILKRLPNLPTDHNNTEIQTLQAKLDKNLEDGPVNTETLTIAMDLVLATFCKESPQHLITKDLTALLSLREDWSSDHGQRHWNYIEKKEGTTQMTIAPSPFGTPIP